ncbi:MBL fold metallo-hydrolase [Pseudomaricurvus sp. HS19]|uniref:MBL fold metallo-hydrolase n=1 Tax=Pseudomaricurvus sp. HS19 TaxID=2692626 RepID=UPI00136BE49F|nr:MBL fold metallo-hydrolase [Pseudomaricurvus sp. HS19]MYM65079.1 MBL fold metallo-hydrolase [Pseudomaricurvus sp. HS19]
MTGSHLVWRQLFDRESSTYTYLLGDAQSRVALLIDPVAGQEEQYLRLLSELGLTLSYALDTHVHADHVTALGTLRELTGCTTLLGEQSQVACVSRTFKDGDVIVVGDIALQALYTPGHTDDSYSFYWQSELGDLLFTGDTLLIRGTGRTDFQNGDARAQYHSLQRLLELPETTWVLPAHDYKGWTRSTLAEEKAHNPRLQVADAEEYARLMASLNLPHPAMMDVAVPANRGCGLTGS